MGNPQVFIDKLKAVRGEDMEDELIAKMETKDLMLHPDFTMDVMMRKSPACANICAWCINIVDFSKIYKKVKPLMETLEGAKTDKRNKEAALAIVEARVKEVEEKVSALKNEL